MDRATASLSWSIRSSLTQPSELSTAGAHFRSPRAIHASSRSNLLVEEGAKGVWQWAPSVSLAVPPDRCDSDPRKEANVTARCLLVYLKVVSTDGARFRRRLTPQTPTRERSTVRGFSNYSTASLIIFSGCLTCGGRSASRPLSRSPLPQFSFVHYLRLAASLTHSFPALCLCINDYALVSTA